MFLVITIVSTVAIEENFDLTTHQSLLIGFIIAIISSLIYFKIRSSRLKKLKEKIKDAQKKSDIIKKEGITFEDAEKNERSES